ncbi:MAG: hypothetical protein ACKVQK_31565 [Burkholderiales bacterium]
MNEKDLEEIFTFHPVKEGQAEKYGAIRAKALELALLINALCPDSRERSLSITKLQEVVMMANGSIAIHS